jgi:hypothetical protein
VNIWVKPANARLQRFINSKVANNFGRTQRLNYGTPNADSFAQTHQKDELARMLHQLRIVVHHSCHRDCSKHRQSSQTNSKRIPVELI